ncbi:MAG: hypothetical protein JWO13_2634 [Acidobacteriales bacterium]|nr:hypothetical protein [Terriglobales bacterium]
MVSQPLVERIKSVTEQLMEIEKEILLRDNIQNPEYISRLTELKTVTDDLRTSIWCSLLPRVSTPEEVKKLLDQHRMKRVLEMLRNMAPEDVTDKINDEVEVGCQPLRSSDKRILAQY